MPQLNSGDRAGFRFDGLGVLCGVVVNVMPNHYVVMIDGRHNLNSADGFYHCPLESVVSEDEWTG